jgi:hypothetical protein
LRKANIVCMQLLIYFREEKVLLLFIDKSPPLRETS